MYNFKDFFKNQNNVLIAVALVGVIVTGVLIFSDNKGGFSLDGILGFGLSSQDVGSRLVDYINNNQLAASPATLVSVSSESGVIKVKIKIGGQEFDSYASKDGKLLFPQAFSMAPKDDGVTKNAGKNNNKNSDTVQKADKPMLEAFVVSRCPYGLQMQRAMAEAVKSVPELASYIKARYIGSVSPSGGSITAMHGDAEAKENLRQICIREEQPTKYWGYVSCQMKKGGTEVSCEQPSGVDSGKLTACIADPGRGVAYAKEDFDISSEFTITGSPTLLLNKGKTSESGFGGRSSDAIRAMVCAGANSQPEFCSKQLNTVAAAVSFSESYSSSGSSASNSAVNCDPAQ